MSPAKIERKSKGWVQYEPVGKSQKVSIDFIITDPPYSTAKRWAEIGARKRPRSRNDDYGFAYKDLDQTIYSALSRVLKPGGHCFIFLSADTEHTLPYNQDQIQLAPAAGLVFNKRFIWNKVSMGMGYSGRNQYENILFLSKGKRHKPYDLSVRDVLSHRKLSPTARRHETEKPVELLRDLLRICARPGDVGLDPFAGSHNFISACQAHGCNSITLELDAAMIKAEVERFDVVQVPDGN